MIPDRVMTDHLSGFPDYQALLKTLREAIKAKGYTYGKIAKELGVSEVSVKRWLSGHTCSLENVFAICERIGISFFDLAALARKEEEVDYVLSVEQERFFASKPAYFGLFKELYRGDSAVQVSRAWGLDSQKFYAVLRRLEKLGLLEVLPKNQFRMQARGNIRYAHRGPLAKAILRPQIIQFLDHIDRVLENDDVCMHSAEVELSHESVNEMVEEIHALGKKYRARALRDKSLLPEKSLRPVRWLFGFAPFQTNWRQYKLD